MKKKDVIKYFGNISETARQLGCHRQAVQQWPDIVPLGRQYQIEVITKGELKAVPKTGKVSKPANSEVE